MNEPIDTKVDVPRAPVASARPIAPASRSPSWKRAGQRAFQRLRPLLRVPQPGAGFAAFLAVLVSSVAYRVTLGEHLLRDPITPYSFVPGARANAMFLRAFAGDLGFAAAVSLVLSCAAALAMRLSPATARAWLTRLGLGVAGLVMFAVGLSSAAHLRALLSLHTGLDASLLLEAANAASQHDLVDYAGSWDLALVVLPLLLFGAGVWLGERALRVRVAIAAIVSLGCFAAAVPLARMRLRAGERVPRVAPELLAVPASYVAGEIWKHLTVKPGKYASAAALLPPHAAQGLRIDGDLPPPPAARADTGTRWNVLFVIMESTGYQYVFNTKRGNALPMPRLSELYDAGLQLGFHNSVGNSSPHAIFGLMTGLYPQPTQNMFSTRPDVRVPGLGSYLGKAYEKIFVTPSRLRSYFPLALLEHDGQSIYGYSEIPGNTPWPGGGRNEIESADFFVQRLRAAKEPFLATYYSYAPHFDYFDHGPEFRIFSDLTDPLLRYYNSLRLLDTQIGRFIDTLRADGRLERTVVVVVGDHGEAFGQHPGNYTHSRRSFQENLRVPALLYQPRLFRPFRVTAPTTHVDILPTLLDAIGVAYDPLTIQGRSLLRGPVERPYIYAWGNEGTLTSFDRDRRKLQVQLEQDKCWYYELREDPKEHTALQCGAEIEPQLDDLLEYWNFQRSALGVYNRSL